MNLKKHLHLQETMVFTIFTYFYSGFLQIPSNAQLRLSEDCRPHLQANCAPCMCVLPRLRLQSRQYRLVLNHRYRRVSK